MPGKHVNYDQIAATYDQRFEHSRQNNTSLALAGLAQGIDAGRILEVGCGTGRWLADMRAVTDQVHGLDLSAGMLARARRREGRLRLVQGRAGQLPFPGVAFDLVYCVNAIHHFDRQRGFVEEARRLLRPGGGLAVVGMDPHGRRRHWYVYDYFEGTYETDLARFPPWETVLGWMREAGLEPIQRRPVGHILDHKVGWAVLEDPFLRKEATSQLALLSEEAYAKGVERLRADLEAAQAAGEQLTFAVDIRVEMLVGRVPCPGA